MCTYLMFSRLSKIHCLCDWRIQSSSLENVFIYLIVSYNLTLAKESFASKNED
ncbi:hypothetical protein HUJ04_010023 [Dendroctonus ponderosae]|nr:hypothetical protein HUJ04_010023 [Dendroctonus ponderosae]